jgi:predicted esterase
LFLFFIVSVSVNIVDQHCWEFLHSFFCMPLADLATTGQPSWNLVGPALFLSLSLIFVSWLLLACYETISRHKSMQKLFLYMSLAVVLVFLNILCFIGLFTAEAAIPWMDVRLLPWWVMILPISLAVFSIAGLSLTRKTKPVVLLCLFLCIVAFPNGLHAAENRIVLLEPAKFVSAKDAQEAAKGESPAGHGGFLAVPIIVDCFAAMEYRYTGGCHENEPIKFRLRSPLTIEPDKKYPLIVWFHGLGESGSDNRHQLAHMQASMEFFAGPNQQDFFMLATQCPGNNNLWTRSLSSEGKGDAPITIAAEIMEALLREYPVDENRISACGLSSGSTAAWEFGRMSPRRLAALGACSGNPMDDAKPEEYLGLSIWAFVNKGDDGVSSEDAIVFVEAINTGGGNAFLSLYDADGHNTWTRALQEEKLIGWLILQSLTKPGPPQGVVCRPLTPVQQFTRFGLPVLIIVACAIPLLFERRKNIQNPVPCDT